MTDTKKIWLILPGGGVKGVFQIGFLKGFFEKNDIEIEKVYGTSIGAILSPLIASKRFDLLDLVFKNVNKITDVLQPWNWFDNLVKILPIYTKLGAYKKVKLVDDILNVIDKNFTDEEKETTYNKCKVVAWDLMNKNEVWFTGDKMPIGMRASSALTIAVPPVEYETGLLTDGGITEIIPITKALEDYEKAEDKDNIILVIVDCSTRQIQKSPKPTDPLFYILDLLYDAASNLSLKELEVAQEKYPNKIHYIKPESELFSSAIDIDKKKMTKVVSDSYNLGKSTNLP